MRPFLLAVMGPTASGKSGLAEHVAEETGAQLVNADAFMVYRGFDIGTNKPKDRDRYRLLDLKEPHEDFGVGEYVTRVLAELESLWEKRQSAIVVGGTGFYIRALFEEWSDLAPAPEPALRQALMSELEAQGLESLVRRLQDLDPALAAQTDLHNPTRVRRALERALGPAGRIEVKLPPFAKAKVALDPPRNDLSEVIEKRTRTLIDQGWLAEVIGLAERGIREDSPAMRAIGYRTLLRVANGGLERSDAHQRISLETKQYAKRQRTWLRSEPSLRLFSSFDGAEVRQEVLRLLLEPNDMRN